MSQLIARKIKDYDKQTKKWKQSAKCYCSLESHSSTQKHSLLLDLFLSDFPVSLLSELTPTIFPNAYARIGCAQINANANFLIGICCLLFGTVRVFHPIIGNVKTIKKLCKFEKKKTSLIFDSIQLFTKRNYDENKTISIFLPFLFS